MHFKEISDLVSISKGKKPISTSVKPGPGLVRYIQIDDLRPGAVIKHCQQDGTVLAIPSDVILAWDGSAGVSESGLEGAVGSTLARLRPKDQNMVTGGYLGEFLKFKEFELRSNTIGSTVPHIDPRFLGSLKVPLPPLDIQVRISKQLSLLRDSIYQVKIQGNLVTELRHSLVDTLLRTSTCANRPLKAITLKIGSGSTPRGGKNSYVAIGPALVRSMNVHDGRFVWDQLARLNEVQAHQLRNVSVLDGDVFLNITGASVARVCRAPSTLGEARVSQHVAIIRPDPALVNPGYLESILMYPPVKSRLIQIAGRGSTREAITKGQIEGFEIPLPAMETQVNFVNRLESTKTFTVEASIRSEKLAELLVTLQNLYFGEPIHE
jgi:type I restriction enzyme S subunit